MSGWTTCVLTAGAATATWATDTGRIERIRAATQRYELVHAAPADRSWMRTTGVPGYVVAVPGSTELADVDTAPGSAATEAGPSRGGTSYRGSAGWVVDLAVER